MKNKSILIIITILFAAITAISYADRNNSSSKTSPEKKYTISGGYVEIDKITYPVYMKVHEVQKFKPGGIMYRIQVKDFKSGKALAIKIYNFYTLKKINRVVVPKFNRVEKTDAFVWSSRKCDKTSDDGVQVNVKINNNSVIVYITPSCNEGVMAEIL
jgi:hypothetical protein